MSIDAFQKIIWNYYSAHGRDLPWRRTRNLYRIVVSEVMLQQTQVSRVIPKYREFIKIFPSFSALDKAPLGNVLRAWQGLGYNRRAASLKKLAGVIMREHRGIVPKEPELLEKLPGIGKGTAGSIAAFAFNAPVPFIETNIRRVFIHFFFPKKRAVSDAEILKFVRKTLPENRAREWYYALMDYGAENLKGVPNPNRRSAHYAKQAPFKGSARELRGKIIALLAKQGSGSVRMLAKKLDIPEEKAKAAIQGLANEGLLKHEGTMVRL